MLSAPQSQGSQPTTSPDPPLLTHRSTGPPLPLPLPLSHKPLPGYKTDRHIELMRSVCELDDEPDNMIGIHIEEAHKVSIL